MQSVYLMGGTLFLLLLAVHMSFQDMKFLCVKRCYCICFISGNLIMAYLVGRSLFFSVLGLLPALILYGASLLHKDLIGMADIYYLIGAGIYLGMWQSVSVLLLSLATAVIYAQYKMRKENADWAIYIALIPFLSMYYAPQICLTAVQYGGGIFRRF